jgi:hypothetical protein
VTFLRELTALRAGWRPKGELGDLGKFPKNSHFTTTSEAAFVAVRLRAALVDPGGIGQWPVFIITAWAVVNFLA